MATVYIAPTAQGSADGTSEANAYAFGSLATAETDAGPGGEIIFLDGTYLSNAFNFEANGVNYKSLNKLGATLEGNSGSLRLITLGHYSTSIVAKSLEGFVVNNCNISSYQGSTSSAKNTIKNNKFTATLSGNNMIQSQTYNTTDLINNSFNIDFDSGSSLSQYYNLGTLNGNTFYIDIDASVTSITSGFDGSSLVGKNNIWVSTDSSKIGISIASRDSFSCFHNYGSSNTSGGTNNVFADPQFVDSTNGDFRLRPSSPCINAGTAS